MRLPAIAIFCYFVGHGHGLGDVIAYVREFDS